MEAKKQPWMKFYPADWRADPALRVCSLAARGLWVEMLCIMHEAEPKGHLLVAGCKLSVPQLAALVGCQPKVVRDLLGELKGANVYSHTADGVIYSRRVVRDVEKAVRDRANGRTGGSPILLGVNPPNKRSNMGGDKAHMPEARVQNYLASIDTGLDDSDSRESEGRSQLKDAA